MNEDLREYKQNINKRIQKRKEIRESKELLNNDNYFIWLNKFSNDMPIFLNNVDYEINDSDKQNIKSIEKLYNLVNIQAKKENIKLNVFSKGAYYLFQNLGVYYQVGFATINNHFVYFCSRCDREENVKIINIDELRKQNNLKKEQDIEELKQLKSLVIKLLERDITEDDIISSVNEGIEQYKGHQLRKIYFDTD